MADCFSLENATELIVKCEEWLSITKRLKANNLTEHIEKCADAIEQLLAENAKLKAERDEYKQKCLSSETEICKSCIRDYFYADIADPDSATYRWEWRGVQND